MHILRLLSFSLFLCCMYGCSSMMPHKDFVASDPEAMHEFQIEGALKSNKLDDKAYFRYREIDGNYQVEIRTEEPTGKPDAIILAKGDDDATIQSNNEKGAKTAEAIKNLLPLQNMTYWLRGLPATETAKVKADSNGVVSHLKEQSWKIDYQDHMQVDHYLLPLTVKMKNDENKVELDMTRAETGFLESPCADYLDSSLTVSNYDFSQKPIQRLVPRDGSAPLPLWINDQDFCKQLIKVHGKIPDPRIGLFGPESMFWKLTAPLTPAGMGAGRALLLQTAHPWVTSGIDEHSIVRYDPLERARRTFTFISVMVYGSMPQVLSAANQVHTIHNKVTGEMKYDAGAFKEHTEYRANEMNAMIWVTSALFETLVTMYEQYEHTLTPAEKNQFNEEIKLFATLFGIPTEAYPATWNDFVAYSHAMWDSPQLKVTRNARTLRDDLFNAKTLIMAFPLWVQEIVTAGSLPPQIREGYGMQYGLWEKFNNAWITTSAKITGKLLPDALGNNAAWHEAHARMKGERVGAYYRYVIKTFLGTETLVN